ncbi:hypothetical protein BDQ17DRAFT_1468981 [Cyathus striatus]|nr:hypothetical protein BDQ17DRAFT_1468981 [Cyathus striatus]
MINGPPSTDQYTRLYMPPLRIPRTKPPMSPSITTRDQDHELHSRPLKRPRKAAAASKPSQPDEPPFTSAAPVDHIFIADGIINKKPVKKCDRNFPCASCKKRGCAEICPDGVLVSGKGTRFILANTEQLHAKIHEMSERIRSLEDALQKLHAEKAPDHHPLMHPDLLGIKSTMGLYSGGQNHNDAGASSRIEMGGHQNGRVPEEQMEVDRGDRGSSEDMDMAVDHPLTGVCRLGFHYLYLSSYPTFSFQERRAFKQENETLASEVLRLSHAFPLPENVNPEPNIPMRSYIRSQLPTRAQADHLWKQARQNALWQ